MGAVSVLVMAVVFAALGAQQGPVNVPYPLSPDEAAKDFLRLVDTLKPRPWTDGQPSGPGPFVVVGTLQAKTLTPDGHAVLMLKLRDGQCVLVKSPSALPAIAIGQRLYMVIDFMGEDGTAAARLRGIALACDLKGRRASLDALLGLQPAEQPNQKIASPPQTRPPASQAAASQPAAPVAGRPALPAPASQTARSPAVAGAVQPQQGGAVAHLGQGWASQATALHAQTPVAAIESPQERYRVQYWTAYARERNPRLSPAEAEAIVRWVLYYSAYYGVDHRLIFAVIRYESDFNPNCVSHAGAIGLMQLMPATARELGVNPWVVEENIKGGIAELAGYLDMYADRSNYEQTVLALASYNAGPNAVKRAGGVPMITETINYVQRVSDLFYRFVKEGAP